VAEFAKWSPRFDLRPVHVGSLVDEVALRHVLPCQHEFNSTLYSYFIPEPTILSHRGDQPDEHISRQK